jgi:hypothetical protein
VTYAPLHRDEVDGRIVAEATELKSGWLDKRAIAAYFDCSVSYIEKRMAEGMPHAQLGVRVKFKPDECESWLEEQGLLRRKSEAAA